MKVAYSDVHRYVADPKTYDAPIAGPISKEYAAKRAALINPNRANCEVKPGEPVGSNTTYLTVVDKDGNIASWIQSVYGFFGSRVTVEGMGFQLQTAARPSPCNRSTPTSWPAASAPFRTIIPAFMEKGDQHIGFGIMGGAVQPLAHAHFVSNIVDYGITSKSRWKRRVSPKTAPRDAMSPSNSACPPLRCKNSPNKATSSASHANMWKAWDEDKPSCTTQRQA